MRQIYSIQSKWTSLLQIKYWNFCSGNLMQCLTSQNAKYSRRQYGLLWIADFKAEDLFLLQLLRLSSYLKSDTPLSTFCFWNVSILETGSEWTIKCHLSFRKLCSTIMHSLVLPYNTLDCTAVYCPTIYSIHTRAQSCTGACLAF